MHKKTKFLRYDSADRVHGTKLDRIVLGPVYELRCCDVSTKYATMRSFGYDFELRIERGPHEDPDDDSLDSRLLGTVLAESRDGYFSREKIDRASEKFFEMIAEGEV